MKFQFVIILFAGPNCLLRLSADDKSLLARKELKKKSFTNFIFVQYLFLPFYLLLLLFVQYLFLPTSSFVVVICTILIFTNFIFCCCYLYNTYFYQLHLLLLLFVQYLFLPFSSFVFCTIPIFTIVLILANSADLDEMQQYAAFHLGLRCFKRYPFRGFSYTKG